VVVRSEGQRLEIKEKHRLRPNCGRKPWSVAQNRAPVDYHNNKIRTQHRRMHGIYSIRVFQIGVTDPKLCFDSEKVLSLAKTIRNRYENVHKAREAGIVS